MPVQDDVRLFEMLVLEGAQSGLSWSTILHKREAYRRVFSEFDPAKVARYSTRSVDRLLADAGIVRNRSKIEAAIANARATLEVQASHGSLDRYLWSFVDGKPIANRWRRIEDIPAETERPRSMSTELRQRGFRFVGPTICHAFMQAVGMTMDHVTTCFRWRELLQLARRAESCSPWTPTRRHRSRWYPYFLGRAQAKGGRSDERTHRHRAVQDPRRKA